MRLHVKPRNLIQLKQSMKYCTTIPSHSKTNAKPSKASLKLVTPRLEKEHIQSLRNISGLHLGTTGISWALLNVENENLYHLLEWNHFLFPTNTQKLHIYDLCKMIYEVKNTLPQSDLYVIESLNPSNRSTTNPIQQGYLELLSQLQSMLCVALNHFDPSLVDHPSLVFLKNRLPARLFNLLIKSECITSRHIIENIISSQLLSDDEYYEEQRILEHTQREARLRSTATTGSTETLEAISERGILNFHTRVSLHDGLVSMYDVSKGYTAESLALALLSGLCFADLIVKPRASVVRRLQLPGA